MIAFLVITSVLNLALGYALALYLGGASVARSAPAPAMGPAVADIPVGSNAFAVGVGFASRPDVNLPPWPVEGVAGAPPAGMPVSPVEESPAQPDFKMAAPEEDEALQARTAEQDLLAGIEEFRNQLAQLKGMGAVAAPAMAGI